MSARQFAFVRQVAALPVSCWANTPVCPCGAGVVILPPPAGTPSINRGRLEFLYFTFKLKI